MVSLPGCYEVSNKARAFELNALPIVIGEVTKVPLIPLSIKIENSEKKHIATICSGLKVENINDMLQSRYNKTLYSNGIKLVNKSVFKLSDDDLNSKLNELFNFKSIIQNYLQDTRLVVYRALKDYPWALEIELNDNFYYYKLRIKSIYFICFFAIFSILIYFLHLINRNYYKNSPSKQTALLQFAPLRTVHASFPAHGSSLFKAIY